jgi:predicted lipoprotein
VKGSASGPCANCGKREATTWWEDALAFTHGMSQPWCEVCALTEQLKYARERAAAIPVMEARLAELGVAR